MKIAVHTIDSDGQPSAEPIRHENHMVFVADDDREYVLVNQRRQYIYPYVRKNGMFYVDKG